MTWRALFSWFQQELGAVNLEEREREVLDAMQADFADQVSDVVRHAREETAAERARRRLGSNVVAIHTWRHRHAERAPTGSSRRTPTTSPTAHR